MVVQARLDTAARPQRPAIDVDHHLVLRGVTWADYERLLVIRGDDPGPRMTYLEGTLELMSPSRPHESHRSLIGCLVEAYAIEEDIDITPVGSWTIKAELRRRGCEPDECYLLADHLDEERPDLAIEVVWTSGSIDKPEVYRGLGVPEVWFWNDGAISVHLLEAEAYVAQPRSALLPGLDLDVVARAAEEPTLKRARTVLLAWLRESRGAPTP